VSSDEREEGNVNTTNLDTNARGIGDMASTVSEVEATDWIMGSGNCDDLVAVLGVVDVRLPTKTRSL
jgi:hypothetical protein